jgi:hypothetical protein
MVETQWTTTCVGVGVLGGGGGQLNNEATKEA